MRELITMLTPGTPIVLCVEGQWGRAIHDLFVVQRPLPPAVLAEYIRQHPERWDWSLESAPLTAWLQREGYIAPIAYTRLHINRHNASSQTWTVEEVCSPGQDVPAVADAYET